MTEYKPISMSDSQWKFIKDNNISLSRFVQNAIDHARCKYIVKIRPDQQKWLESHHMNINMLLMDAIDVEMKNNGR